MSTNIQDYYFKYIHALESTKYLEINGELTKLIFIGSSMVPLCISNREVIQVPLQFKYFCTADFIFVFIIRHLF